MITPEEVAFNLLSFTQRCNSVNLFQIERIIQASGAHGCQQMLIHTAAKHIKEHHVWFSIFFKSNRSRYTRLQRTSTAFALLFLSMLVDAMWYGIVPEEKTGQGFTFGFLTLTPAEAFIGSMVHTHSFFYKQRIKWNTSVRNSYF